MLSATLAVEGHTPNFVFSPTAPVAFRHHLPPLPPTQQQQQQHNLQQHQLHVQYLHQQYLAQQQQQHQQRQHLHPQFHRTPHDLFNSYGLQPAPQFTPTLLDSWHRDLISVASVTKPFLNNRRLSTPITNSSTGTCTITSGSLQSNHKPLNANANVPEFLIPQVPIKPLVQNNRINGQKYVQQPTSSAPTNVNASANDTRHSSATNNTSTDTNPNSNSNPNPNPEMPVNLTIQPNSSKNLPPNDGVVKLPSPSPSPTTPYSPYARFFPNPVNTSGTTQFPMFPAIIFQPHSIQHPQVQQQQHQQHQEPYILASNTPTYIVPHPGLPVPSLETVMQQTEKRLPFKVPAGKEGSLKHRILTRLSPEPTNLTVENSSLPLEAEDLSIKVAKHTNNENGTGTGTGTGTGSSRSSSHSGGSGSGSRTNSPKTEKKECYQTFNSFLKGSLIQLANGVIKKIEEMTTDDFVQCAKFRPDLKLLDSTIVKINADSTKSFDCIHITVHYNEHHSQFSIECVSSVKILLGRTLFEKILKIPEIIQKADIIIVIRNYRERDILLMVIPTRSNHPFFVYKQGWASYDPELTEQSYGIKCRQLNVGDIIVSLQPQDHLEMLSRDPKTEPVKTTKPRPPPLTPTTTTTTTGSKQSSPLQSPSYPQSPSINQPKPLSLTKKRKASSPTPNSPLQKSPHQPLSSSNSSNGNNYVNVPNSTSSVMLTNSNDDKKVAKIRRLSSQDAHNNNMTPYLATSK